MSEMLVIALLAALNVVQAVFWMRQTQKLVDKLMSRNYAEYSQSVNLSQSTKATSSQSESPALDAEHDFRTLEGIGL